MRRMIALLLTGAFLLLLCGCGEKPAQESQKEDTEPETTEQQEEPEETAVTDPVPTETPDTVPEPEPEPESVTVTLYYGDENAEHLLSREVEVEELDSQTLVDLLYDQGVFSHPVTVNHCEVEDKLIRLDLDEHFETMLQSTGTAGEFIIMGSLVNTFLDAYEGEQVELTVNGEILETGHTIYDQPLTFYES